MKTLLAAVLSTVLAAFVVANAGAAGAEGSEAERRATLFQAEARRIFAHDHWAIVREGGGGFTAVHAAESGGEITPDKTDKPPPPLLVHVSITFQPRSDSSTDCSFKVEGFRLTPREAGKHAKLSGPFKADYPENAAYIRKVLETAENRLGKKYPKFEAK